MSGRLYGVFFLLVLLGLGGCDGGPWNDPYPAHEAHGDVYYSSFAERPKHLDPARSYSSNEWSFISQIYEPLLQYHFLKRPYEQSMLTKLAGVRSRHQPRYSVSSPYPPGQNGASVA